MGKHRRRTRVENAQATAVKTVAALGIAGTLALAVHSTTGNDAPAHAPSDITAQGPTADRPAQTETTESAGNAEDATTPKREKPERTQLSPSASAEPELVTDSADSTDGSDSGVQSEESSAQAGSPESAAPRTASSQAPTSSSGDDGQAPSGSDRPSSPGQAPGGGSTTPDDDQQSEEPSGGGGEQDGLVGGVVDGVGGVVDGVTGSLGLGG